jgi:hypothetical protein
MKTALRLTRLAGTTALLVSACALGHPTGHDVVNTSTPAICQKAKECAGDGKFSRAYGSMDDCISKTKAAVEAQRSDLDRHSACSDSEVDKCINDLKAAACPTQPINGVALPTVPCDC